MSISKEDPAELFATPVARPLNGKPLAKGGLLFGSVIAMMPALYHIVTQAQTEPGWEVEISIVCFGWLAIYLVSSYSHFRTFYLFSNFYIAALLLFHLGITIASVFNWFQDVAWGSGPLSPWLELSGWYVILSLGCFGIGFASSLRGKRRDTPDDDPVRARTMAWAYWDGVGLLLASGLFLGLSIATVGNLLAYSRADFFKGVGDTRGLGVFLMIFPSALALMVLGAKRGVRKWVAVIMALAGFVLVMLSGYRTTALYPFIMGAIIWTKCKRRIPLPLVVGGILIVVLGISFVGVLRQLGPYDSLNEKTVKTSLDQTSVKDTVLLGQTGGLLAHVLRLVPREDPYRYGMTYLVGLIDAIPNVGLQIGKSKRAEVRSTVSIGYDKFETLPPSDWLTYRVAPWAFDIGQGVGFTTIGEAYLNFGMIGVIGFFALVGFFLGKLDQIDLLHHPGWFVFASAFLWHFMRTVRDDLSNFTKPALFTLIIIAIWRISRKFWLFRTR